MRNSKLIAKLKNRKYREAFVASQINIGIPFQLRALLKATPWTQQELAENAGMLQPRISSMLKPGGAKFTLETLKRLAAAFDVALLVKFVPFSELVNWAEEFDPDNFCVPPFNQDIDLITEHVAIADSNDPSPTIDAAIAQIEEEWPQFLAEGSRRASNAEIDKNEIFFAATTG